MIVETVRLRFLNRRRSSNGWTGRKLQTTKPATMTSPRVPGMMTLLEKKVPSPGIEEMP